MLLVLEYLGFDILQAEDLLFERLNLALMLFQLVMLLVKVIKFLLQTLNVQLHLLLTPDVVPALRLQLPQDLLVLTVSLGD